MSVTEFKEVQTFRRWWAWLGIIAINALFIYAIIQQVILKQPFGSKPASNIVLILLEIIPLLLLIFVFSIKLKTTINSDGIYYRYYPFQFKTTFISWDELSDAYLREYNSLYEYGGWGIRIGTAKTGNAINTSASSNIGLQLKFRDGELLLIGTRRPGEIKLIIDAMIAEGKIAKLYQ